MSFRVGENIGPYQLLERIGEGGMGTVFKAYHPLLDRYVALKIIHPAHREDQNFIARFKREARLVAKLDHANIVPIHDYAEQENISYLVMKFIEGSTLKDRLAQGPLSFDEVLGVVDSVGPALSYAHRQGILHRDIKPSNVLIGNNGAIYLADFGLARVTQAEISTLSSESSLGTPHYVSPEQALGKGGLDERTDVYSFGVMLYEIIVGQPPFSANTGFAIIHDQIYTPPPLPHTLNPNVSESVEQVLLKALAKDPNDRFETVDQMVVAFKNAWRSANNLAGGSIPSAISIPYRSLPSNENLQAVQKSASPKKRRMEWLYVLMGIVLGIVLAFSLVPNLRGRVMATLKSMRKSVVSVEITPTNSLTTPSLQFTSPVLGADKKTTLEATSTNQAPTATATPIPKSTNTSAPSSTTQPTKPLQNILTSPPIIKTVVNQATVIPPVINTVVNQVTNVPPIISSVLPSLP